LIKPMTSDVKTTGMAADCAGLPQAEKLVGEAEPFVVRDSMLRGWLRLRSGKAGPGGDTSATAWRDRFAVLSRRALALYRIAEVVDSANNRSFAVQRVALVPLLSVGGVVRVAQCDFAVECGAGKYRLRAASSAERDDWVAAIDIARHAVQNATAQL